MALKILSVGHHPIHTKVTPFRVSPEKFYMRFSQIPKYPICLFLNKQWIWGTECLTPFSASIKKQIKVNSLGDMYEEL
jgi:hypothetical protein